MLKQLLAAPITVSIGGENWVLSPLTLMDQTVLESFLNEQYLKVCLERREMIKDPVLQEQFWKESMVKLDTGMGAAEVLSSSYGYGFMLWLSVKKGRNIELSEFLEKVSGADVMELEKAMELLSEGNEEVKDRLKN